MNERTGSGNLDSTRRQHGNGSGTVVFPSTRRAATSISRTALGQSRSFTTRVRIRQTTNTRIRRLLLPARRWRRSRPAVIAADSLHARQQRQRSRRPSRFNHRRHLRAGHEHQRSPEASRRRSWNGVHRTVRRPGSAPSAQQLPSRSDSTSELIGPVRTHSSRAGDRPQSQPERMSTSAPIQAQLAYSSARSRATTAAQSAMFISSAARAGGSQTGVVAGGLVGKNEGLIAGVTVPVSTATPASSANLPSVSVERGEQHRRRLRRPQRRHDHCFSTARHRGGHRAPAGAISAGSPG